MNRLRHTKGIAAAAAARKEMAAKPREPERAVDLPQQRRGPHDLTARHVGRERDRLRNVTEQLADLLLVSGVRRVSDCAGVPQARAVGLRHLWVGRRVVVDRLHASVRCHVDDWRCELVRRPSCVLVRRRQRGESRSRRPSNIRTSGFHAKSRPSHGGNNTWRAVFVIHGIE